jgi:hypothetical protein
MKKFIIVITFLFSSTLLMAQSATTQALASQFSDAFSLYFYKNTLRMLNQNDSPEFDEMIKNIEKMRFLRIDKDEAKFGKNEYKKLVSTYQSESFESMMTGRSNGRNFDVYIKDQKNSPLGTVVLVNDSSSLYVLDIIGTIDMSKASQLFQTLSQSSDIGQQFKQYTNQNEKWKAKKSRAEEEKK